MDLQDFMDLNAGLAPGDDLITSGRFSQAVYSVVRNEGTTRALIANNYWRAFLASDAFRRALIALDASTDALHGAQTIVVPREHLNRFDLLVLDPGLAGSSPPRPIELTPLNFLLSDVASGATAAAMSGTPNAIGRNFMDLALETANDKRLRWSVVLAPKPKTERLHVPSTAIVVERGSTAGVVVECLRNPGTVGVTAALHGVANAGWTVDVDGQPGSLLRASAITDSAFVSLAQAPMGNAIHTTGILSGIAPRGNQAASFVGMTSGATATTICGWDPQIPNPSANRQALVYTGRDAQPGDSGAALVTDAGEIVGFAFERTLPNQNPVQCSWVWADSVLRALEVKLI